MINPPACSQPEVQLLQRRDRRPQHGDTFNYRWNWGDGTAGSTSTSPSHTFPAAGTYTVTLTSTDGWGKASVVTRQVTVAP